MYEWLKLDEDEQISFVMYGSYEEQMKFLKDEQLGKLIRNVYHYVKTGEQKSVEPIIDMMLSVIANDIRNQKRNQKKKSEAGKAGGEASVRSKEAKKTEKSDTKKGAKKTGKKQEPEAGEKSLNHFEAASGSASSNDNDFQRPSTIVNQYVDVDEDVDKDMDVDVDGDVDADVDVCDKTSRRLRQCSGSTGACEDVQSEIVFYTDEQIPTTDAVLEQVQSLTAELFGTYRQQKPGPYDMERVFERVYGIAENPLGQHYAVYSDEKADLLRHVFRQAADQGNLNWKYIDGIYENYERRGVETLEQAIENEYKWQRGEIAV